MHILSQRARTGVGTALAVAVLLGWCGCTPPGPRALLKGDRLLQRDRAAQAVPHLERAVGLLPEEPRAWNHLGLAYHAAGRPAEAEKAYRRALAIKTNFAVASFNLGCLLLDQEEPERALPELATYTLLESNAPLGWLKLGYAQLGVNQAAAAERSFALALQLQTNSPEAINGLGLSLAQRRRPAQAWPYFAAASQLDPEYAPAQLNMAVLTHQASRDRSQAASAYERYLALRDAPYQEEVRVLLHQLQPPPEPEPKPAVAEAVAVKPGPEPALVETSRPPARVVEPSATAKSEVVTARELEKSEGAPAVVAESPRPPARVIEPVEPPKTDGKSTGVVATKPGPSSPSAIREPQRDDEASPKDAAPEKVVARVVEPQSPPAAPSTIRSNAPPTTQRSAPGRTLSPATASVAPTQSPRPATGPEVVATADNRPTVAPVAPRPAAEVEIPSHLQVSGSGYPYAPFVRPAPGDRVEAIRLLNRGIDAHRALRPDEALELYRQAAETDSSLFEVHYNRGVVAFEQGEMGEALRAYEQALAVDADSVPARFNFATTLRRSGYPAEAAAQLEHLLVAHPDETRAHLALGDLYARHFRDRQRARERYLRVLELEPQHPSAPALRLWLDAN